MAHTVFRQGNSFIEYVCDSLVDPLVIPFLFIHEDHIRVYVNGIEDENATVFQHLFCGEGPDDPCPSYRHIGHYHATPSAYQIGDTIRIQRVTISNARTVEFTRENITRPETLERGAQELFFGYQESVENTSAIKDVQDWNFNDKRIINVGEPTEDTDLPTKNYADITVVNPNPIANPEYLAGAFMDKVTKAYAQSEHIHESYVDDIIAAHGGSFVGFPEATAAADFAVVATSGGLYAQRDQTFTTSATPNVLDTMHSATFKSNVSPNPPSSVEPEGIRVVSYPTQGRIIYYGGGIFKMEWVLEFTSPVTDGTIVEFGIYHSTFEKKFRQPCRVKLVDANKLYRVHFTGLDGYSGDGYDQAQWEIMLKVRANAASVPLTFKRCDFRGFRLLDTLFGPDLWAIT